MYAIYTESCLSSYIHIKVVLAFLEERYIVLLIFLGRLHMIDIHIYLATQFVIGGNLIVGMLTVQGYYLHVLLIVTIIFLQYTSLSTACLNHCSHPHY